MGHDDDAAERRRLAWVLGAIAEGVLVWWLVQAARTDSSEDPALPVGDGLLLTGRSSPSRCSWSEERWRWQPCSVGT